MKAYFFVLAFLLFSSFSLGASDFSDLTLSNVQRTIDLTSQFSRQQVTLKATATKSTSVFNLALEKSFADRLSLLTASDSSGNQLKYSKGASGESNSNGQKVSYTLFPIQLAKALASGESAELTVNLVFTHTMVPFPKAIAVNEKQKVLYHDNHFFFTPYSSSSQKTVVTLPSSSIESKSELAPTSVQGSSITYGPYSDVAPFSSSQMRVHFENLSPFLTITAMRKEIEISHWGNVAEEITIDELIHEGAALKTPFSRYDFTRNPSGFSSAVNNIRQYLPTGAADVYYRDEIGNISTSNWNVPDSGRDTLDLRPRFPLFGGWKIGFYLGYNLPASEYLFTSGDDSAVHVLKAPFFVSLEGTVADRYVLRVILPEGAQDIEVHTPFSIDKQSQDVHFTYLDTFGRPVVVLEKSNVIPDHDQTFYVSYRFSTLSLLREPLLLVFGFFFFFVTAMLYVRFEFTIGQK